jgi:hypothetical protein
MKPTREHCHSAVTQRSTTWLIRGALPLLIYPCCVVADVMSLAGHRSGDEPLVSVLVVLSFLYDNLAYPVVYLVCLGCSLSVRFWEKHEAAYRFSIAPLWYLAVLCAISVGTFIWSLLYYVFYGLL